DDLHQIHYVLDAITAVRESRVTYEVKPSKLLSIQLLDSNNASYNLSKTIKDMFEQMSKTEIVDSISEQLNIPIHNGSIVLEKEELVDKEALREKLLKEKDHLEKEIKRAKGMLANENFVNKAPEAKVNEEREKLKEYERQLDVVLKQLED
ncbi:MAG: valine--tRNA ligase, partial [Erysipelothrix sp.]|nr:valine--tRNA ligase [Erysipelothrix sp.]